MGWKNAWTLEVVSMDSRENAKAPALVDGCSEPSLILDLEKDESLAFFSTFQRHGHLGPILMFS